MRKFFEKDTWSPYLAGALIGILLGACFLVGHKIGVSSGVARVSALIEYAVAPASIEPGSFFEKLLSDHVIFDWKILFISGLFLGAWLATWVATEQAPHKNTIWIRRYGDSKAKRYFAAFIGGFLLLFGARLSEGCTSGQAISGGAQLSVVSWIFMLTLFAIGIPVSYLLYKTPDS